MCVRERERARARERERQRERVVSVCVCVCVKERDASERKSMRTVRTSETQSPSDSHSPLGPP